MRFISTARNLKAQGRARGQQLRQIRWQSTQPPPPASTKEISPHVAFYKTFTRPVAKVLLMATFTYQLAYWAWVKLEKEEIKTERKTEIEELEARLSDLTRKNVP